MSITVSLPIGKPTGLNATLVDGGSLDPNTTYYYVIVAYFNNNVTPISYAVEVYHGPISDEASFTTDTTNLSALIKWTNPPGHTSLSRYQLLLTKVSGDYTSSGTYGMTTVEYISATMTDGAIGYTVTALSIVLWCVHSYQLVNDLLGGIDKALGILKVEFTGTSTHTIQQVYDAIVSAGYSDYVRWNGYEFIFKGWLYCAVETTDAGLFNVTGKRMTFIKGGIKNRSDSYIFRFGSLLSETKGAHPDNACVIDIIHSRYAFLTYYGSGIEFYGGLLSKGKGRLTTYSEYLNIESYYANSNSYIGYNVSGFRDVMIGFYGRSNLGDIKDISWRQGNNWGNYNHIRLKVLDSANMPYKAGGKFYNCNWLDLAYLNMYVFSGTEGYYTNMYDMDFSIFPNGMIDNPYVRYSSLASPDYQSNNYFQFFYSLQMTVLDAAGDVLEDVIISAVDKDNNPVNWIEKDGSTDELISGNEYTSNRLTDVNGKVDYYMLSYHIMLNPDYAGP